MSFEIKELRKKLLCDCTFSDTYMISQHPMMSISNSQVYAMARRQSVERLARKIHEQIETVKIDDRYNPDREPVVRLVTEVMMIKPQEFNELICAVIQQMPIAMLHHIREGKRRL